MSDRVDVAVIGAGFAGIAAARALRDQGLAVRVLEARERVGGRAWTIDLAPGTAFDCGCSWLHCADINPLVPLAEGAGFTLVRANPQLQLYRGGEPLPPGEIDDYRAASGRVFAAAQAAGEQGSNATLGEFVDLAGRWRPQVENVIRGIWGVDPQAHGVDDYAAEHDTDTNWPVEEGLGRLAQHLAEGLPIMLNSAVETVEWSAPEVRLVSSGGDLRARAVVVTVPTDVLTASGVHFAPALPARKRAAAEALPLGRSEKLALLFEGDPLPVPRNSFTALVGGDEAFGFYRFPGPATLTITFFGGSRAERMRAAGEAAAIEFAIERLAAVWGDGVRAAFRQGLMTHWQDERWTRGGYSAARPGMSASRGRLAEPLEQRLFFAGEATSEHYFATAHGAWWSGERAAAEVAAALSG